MIEWMYILILTLMAGLAIPLGGLLATVDTVRPNWLNEELRHSVTAFGGGALLSAVALVLVPEGIEPFSNLAAVSLFLLGGCLFMWIDIALYKLHTSAGQLVAMLSDFIPESIALGASIALGKGSSLLIASLIMMQNLPEGFNAFRELKESSHYSTRKIIVLFTVLALLGPVAGLSAYYWLSNFDALISGIMLVAAGGILYAVFQDIAPQVKLDFHWAPPLGAVLGFVLGLAGFMMSH
ncbi:ZIP family metal transporter [Marinomonas ostreistagni]|uniref:ZIP family metal transporter n=1 Tax=Marinomonas ostreistagni TaxID=359209 RepID=UPI00194EA80D|nr:divalent cation transporter [Marinomonas ostreistagni]MBM6550270.1 divalent cation transporter [Marinomonas ostreistagni]